MKKTMAKIKMSLTNNVGLKVIAVVIAAIVWLAVVNISDPEKTVVIYNVPVTVTNEESITDLDMVYTVESGRYVDITVSGQRSIVSNLTSDDFKVTASLKELSKVNTVPIEIESKNKSIGRKITIVKQSIKSMTVDLEELKNQKFDVEVEFSGNIEDGYVVGDYSLSNSAVYVNAPVSVLDRIAKAVATCDVSGKNSDFTENVKVILYDKHGEVVKNKYLTLSKKKIGIFVDVHKEKEIPIVYDVIGEPAEGHQISDITLSKEKVKVSGVEDVLADIKEIDITSDINIANISKNTTFKVKLDEKLPEGVTISGDSEIEVVVKVYKLTTKTFKIKTSKIDVENLKEGLEISYPSDEIEITLRGEKSVINDIAKQDIGVSIDLKGEDKGTVTAPVSIKIPNDTELLEDVTVKVKIK